MTISDMEMKELGRSSWNDTHNMISLIHTSQICLIHTCRLKKPARWKSINTHTHTHTHTRTHTHTHQVCYTRYQVLSYLWQFGPALNTVKFQNIMSRIVHLWIRIIFKHLLRKLWVTKEFLEKKCNFQKESWKTT